MASASSNCRIRLLISEIFLCSWSVSARMNLVNGLSKPQRPMSEILQTCCPDLPRGFLGGVVRDAGRPAGEHLPQGHILSHPRLRHELQGTFLSHLSFKRRHSAQDSSPIPDMSRFSRIRDHNTPRIRFSSMSFSSSCVMFFCVRRVGIIRVLSTGILYRSIKVRMKW